VRAVSDQELVSSIPEPSTGAGFSFERAVLAAGFSFETYSEPANSRWERGSKGTDVAFISQTFTRSLYRGVLQVSVLECTELPQEQDAAQKVLSGDAPDAYCLLAIVEGREKEDKEMIENRFNSGVKELQRSSCIARTTTVWSNNSNTEETGNNFKKTKKDSVSSWGKNESHYLYTQDPNEAVLALSIMDEEVMADDKVIGSCTVSLKSVMGPLEDEARDWSGWVPLSTGPPQKDKKAQMMAGATAGGMVFGPAGAAFGGIAGALWEKGVKGKVKLSLRYIPLVQLEKEAGVPEMRVSACEGVDWGALGSSVGGEATQNSAYELCCFVSHQETGCTAGIYRSTELKKIVLAFRGTCAPVDLITDISLMQTPWVEGEADDTALMVHKGFRGSLQSISRRMKELALVAAGGDIEDWEVLITGHSLGGALASLCAADLAQYGLDAGRGLPTQAPTQPWWGRLINGKQQEATLTVPRAKEIKMYSFGAPRVGNTAFVTHFESLGMKDVYRVVNGKDVVARLPRSVNAGFTKVEYSHCGQTALVTETAFETVDANEIDEALDEEGNTKQVPKSVAVWVEGESDNALCPVKDNTFSASPFKKGYILGDMKDAVAGINLKGGWDIASKVSAAMDKMGERLDKASMAEAATIVGIDPAFVAREMSLLTSIKSGEAVQHHLEPAYYSAICLAATAKEFVIKMPEVVAPILTEEQAAMLKLNKDVQAKVAALQATLVTGEQYQALGQLSDSLNRYMEAVDVNYTSN